MRVTRGVAERGTTRQRAAAASIPALATAWISRGVTIGLF